MRVVATDVGEVQPFVLYPEGVVPPRNPERLAAAMLCVLSREHYPASEPVRARRRKLEQRFSLTAMMARYGEAYVAPR